MRFQRLRGFQDISGDEARRFGAATSGEALLYSPSGKLLFHGGITPSRGHEGGSVGRDALVRCVLDGTPAPATTPSPAPPAEAVPVK